MRVDLGVSESPPAAAAAPDPSTALVHLNGREHAPGGVVEIGAQRVATAGNLLQEAGHGGQPVMLCQILQQIRVCSYCYACIALVKQKWFGSLASSIKAIDHT